MEATLLVVDRQGNALAELPEAGLQDCSWVLNRPGTANFTINPLSPGADKMRLFSREIQIWLDGDLRWWGVPWDVSGTQNLQTYVCDGLLSLFIKRFIDRTSLQYTSIEQRSIAWNLINYAQSDAPDGQTNRDFNIDAATFSGTTHTRSRLYERDQHQNILDLLYEFPRLQDGFDFDIAIFGDGRREWTPYYPRKGSLRPKHRIEWLEGGKSRNIVGFSYSGSARSLASEVYVTGGTSGDVKFEGKYEDVQASVDNSGVTQAFISEGQVLDPLWLEERAQREVEQRKHPEQLPILTGAFGLKAKPFDELETGDDIPVLINHGAIQFDENKRIITKRYRHLGGVFDFEFAEVG